MCRFVAAVAFLLLAGLSPRVAAAQTFSLTDSSTAVADFNADGRPDIAIANHIGGGNAAYRIDIQLSNGHPQSISFLSAQFGLRVAAVDVDNDHDLDLVVTPLLGRDVVGVWLNDGAGHFGRSEEGALPSDFGRVSPTTVAGCPPACVVATSTTHRMSPASPSSRRITAVNNATRPRPAPRAAALDRLVSSLSPRAPPSRL
jgi:VCBS repeat protein